MVISYFPGRGTVFEEAYYDGEAKGKAAGIAAGMAKAVLRILENRGIAASDDVRTRVSDCTDLARLDDWLGRAVTVDQAEELFTGMPDEPQEEPDSA
ncbi:hypothetical protein ACFWR9_36390 [Streptomyces sp. NPDC058534]|uniref:hypothetical protein n=1 Tax=Streptomyces sp. NPDC058534 TaxID=3346541 RepID=UPI00366368AD